MIHDVPTPAFGFASATGKEFSINLANIQTAELREAIYCATKGFVVVRSVFVRSVELVFRNKTLRLPFPTHRDIHQDHIPASQQVDGASCPLIHYVSWFQVTPIARCEEIDQLGEIGRAGSLQLFLSAQNIKLAVCFLPANRATPYFPRHIQPLRGTGDKCFPVVWAHTAPSHYRCTDDWQAGCRA